MKPGNPQLHGQRFLTLPGAFILLLLSTHQGHGAQLRL